MHNHLIIYDGTCGLCDNIVQFLLKADRQESFVFAPLQGKTASQYVAKLDPEIDSMILVENFQTNPQVFVLSQGVLRICWLLGGLWKLPGTLSFLPGWYFNWAYRFVATHRYRWFARRCLVPTQATKHRFLP